MLVNPSIPSLPFIFTKVAGEELEPIPATRLREAGYTLDRRQPDMGLAQ